MKKRRLPRPIRAAALTLMCALATGNAVAQAPSPQRPGPLPPAIATSLDALRDAMYQSEAPEAVEKAAERLATAIGEAALAPAERALALSRARYFVARSWKEVNNKAKAIPHYEEAMAQARVALAAGETPARLIALMKPLSELCLLKDMAFLIANGPKVGQYARRALALEPGYPAATIAIAASKAYPPPIFGGNPKEAIAEMEALLAARPGGLGKDDLFDLRMCVATACEKLGREAEAARWFTSALELYPGNAYAKEQLRKIAQ